MQENKHGKHQAEHHQTIPGLYSFEASDRPDWAVDVGEGNAQLPTIGKPRQAERERSKIWPAGRPEVEDRAVSKKRDRDLITEFHALTLSAIESNLRTRFLFRVQNAIELQNHLEARIESDGENASVVNATLTIALLNRWIETETKILLFLEGNSHPSRKTTQEFLEGNFDPSRKNPQKFLEGKNSTKSLERRGMLSGDNSPSLEKILVTPLGKSHPSRKSPEKFLEGLFFPSRKNPDIDERVKEPTAPRLKGDGSGWLYTQTRKKKGKTYIEHHYQVEFWESGKRRRSCYYVPKKLLSRIAYLESVKAPIEQIISVILGK